MPGNPIAKSQRIGRAVHQLASDFDKLLSASYRYNGQPPTGDRRADAWAAADQHLITTVAALGELRDVLRGYAKRPATDEPNADVNGEVVHNCTDTE